MTTFNAISSCPYTVTSGDSSICFEETDTTFKQKLVQGYEFKNNEEQGKTVIEDGSTTFML